MRDRTDAHIFAEPWVNTRSRRGEPQARGGAETLFRLIDFRYARRQLLQGRHGWSVRHDNGQLSCHRQAFTLSILVAAFTARVRVRKTHRTWTIPAPRRS